MRTVGIQVGRLRTLMRLALLLAIGALFVFSAVLMGPDKSASAGEPHGNDSQADSESYVAIDDSRRVEVLKSISEKIRKNRDAIRTWSGTFRFQDDAVLNRQQAEKVFGSKAITKLGLTPPLSKKDRGRGSFVVDNATNSLFVDFRNESTELREQRGERIAELDRAKFWQRTILTPEHYLHIQPEQVYGGFEIAPDAEPRQGCAAFRDPVAKAKEEEWGIVVDPRRVFDAGRPFYEEFEVYAQAVERGGESADAIEVKEWAADKGMRYRIKVSGVPSAVGSPKVELWTTVAEEAGFNPVRFDVLVDGNTHQYTSWQYRDIHGALVPTTVFRMVATADGKSVAFQRALTIEDSKLNEDIPAQGFTASAIGLKEGERLLDRIENKLFVLTNGELKRIDGGLDQAVDRIEQ